ncbi:hypothetical protein HY491_00715, partial [Candidatus Woesearchaeota archaeon]|nr:hypothetical protein [Candidatus Woesearchaeota archaeon]
MNTKLMILVALGLLISLAGVQAGVNCPTNKCLVIESVDVKVDGDTDKGVVDGSRISQDAQPESDIQVKVTVRNKYTRTENVDVESIDITATLVGIDDGDDLEETDDIERVRPESTKSVTMNFDVPLKVDEGEYDLVIEFDVGDDNSTSYIIPWKARLEVDKKTHELRIQRAELSRPVLECKRTATLDILLMNFGSDDEDEVVLTVTNEDLGINTKDQFELVADAFDDENSFAKRINLNLPMNFAANIYPVVIQAFRNTDELKAQKTVDVTVADCTEKQEVKETPKEEIVVTPPKQESTTPDFITQPVPLEQPKTFWEQYGTAAVIIGGEFLVLVIIIVI